MLVRLKFHIAFLNMKSNMAKTNIERKFIGGFKMIIDRIALFLLIVGGINWGSIGLFGFDKIHFKFLQVLDDRGILPHILHTSYILLFLSTGS